MLFGNRILKLQNLRDLVAKGRQKIIKPSYRMDNIVLIKFACEPQPESPFGNSTDYSWPGSTIRKSYQLSWNYRATAGHQSYLMASLGQSIDQIAENALRPKGGLLRNQGHAFRSR
jgi:hypothetical protein